MMEGNSHIITIKGIMVASRGMFMRNVAYIPPNCKDIRIADMSESGVTGRCCLEERLLNKSNISHYRGV